MTLTLFTHPFSRGRIARWMLEEVGTDYQVELVDFDAPRPEALLRANPMGKLPTLLDDDAVVTEAAAICAYLASRFPEAGLAPQPDEMAEFWRWLFFAAGPLEQAVIANSFNWSYEGREVNVGFGSFDRTIDALDGKLDRDDFVAGGRFTAADVYLAASLGWSMMSGGVPKRPAFEAYVARCTERPAAQRATAADNALAAELQETSHQDG